MALAALTAGLAGCADISPHGVALSENCIVIPAQLGAANPKPGPKLCGQQALRWCSQRSHMPLGGTCSSIQQEPKQFVYSAAAEGGCIEEPVHLVRLCGSDAQRWCQAHPDVDALRGSCYGVSGWKGSSSEQATAAGTAAGSQGNGAASGGQPSQHLPVCDPNTPMPPCVTTDSAGNVTSTYQPGGTPPTQSQLNGGGSTPNASGGGPSGSASGGGGSSGSASSGGGGSSGGSCATCSQTPAGPGGGTPPAGSGAGTPSSGSAGGTP